MQAQQPRVISAPESADLTPHGKRLFPRMRASLPVRFSVGHRSCTGRTDNVSIRGMLLLADGAPEMAQPVTVLVTMPNGNEAAVEARVTFVAPGPFDPGYPRAFAVELTHPSEELSAFVGLLVAAKTRKRGF